MEIIVDAIDNSENTWLSFALELHSGSGITLG